MMRLDYETYEKSVYRDGVRLSHRDEEVTAEFVDRFLGAAPFFDALVSEPERQEKLTSGTIKVTQTTPDGETQVTLFEPVGGKR
jgi:hypothetical protein